MIGMTNLESDQATRMTKNFNLQRRRYEQIAFSNHKVIINYKHRQAGQLERANIASAQRNSHSVTFCETFHSTL